MTKLGEYLARKSANKAEIGRRAGISRSRMTELANNSSTRLTADELYLIALAMDDNPCDVFVKICGHLKLPASTDSKTINDNTAKKD